MADPAQSISDEPTQPVPAPAAERVDYEGLGRLRAFATILVLAHHALLAYHPAAPPVPDSLIPQPRWWQAFPVVDPERFGAFALVVGWNDIFLMALLFFVSGLFLPGSVARRGVRSFVASRFLRLGIPFVLLAGVIAPLAYYPTYLETASPEGLSGYVREWLALGSWPGGPAWFLWLLLAFDLLAASTLALWKEWPRRTARRAAGLFERPVTCGLVLVGLSALAYLPLRMHFGSLHWTEVGPLAFQTPRLLHYALYFAFGVVVGSYGLNRGLLAPEGSLAKGGAAWMGTAGGALGATAGVAAMAASPDASVAWQWASGLGFVVTCAATTFGLLGLFVRFSRTKRPIWSSLRANAYGMYVVHYAIASWLQYAALGWSAPAAIKGLTVLAATVLLSWLTTASLRLVPGVRHVL